MTNPFDPFEGLPPFDPINLSLTPPPGLLAKIAEEMGDVLSKLNDEDRGHFDHMMSVLTSMGFGAMAMAQFTGETPAFQAGQVIGVTDRALLAFVEFTSMIAKLAIESVVPPDHPAREMISNGQLHMIMGLVAGYRLRQEQEGKH